MPGLCGRNHGDILERKFTTFRTGWSLLADSQTSDELAAGVMHRDACPKPLFPLTWTQLCQTHENLPPTFR